MSPQKPQLGDFFPWILPILYVFNTAGDLIQDAGRLQLIPILASSTIGMVISALGIVTILFLIPYPRQASSPTPNQPKGIKHWFRSQPLVFRHYIVLTLIILLIMLVSLAFQMSTSATALVDLSAYERMLGLNVIASGLTVALMVGLWLALTLWERHPDKWAPALISLVFVLCFGGMQVHSMISDLASLGFFSGLTGLWLNTLLLLLISVGMIACILRVARAVSRQS